MQSTRREFLKKAALAGISLAGGGVLHEVLSANELSAELARETSVKTRWAMVVDMSRCAKREHCTDCITACRRAHNVPLIVSKRHEIKWIWKDSFEHAFPELASDYLRSDLKASPFILLCNHCDNPPCVRVCPTKATWKRPDGIVMMDMHRCIGCRYCMAGCPYGSRSFNWMDPRKALKDSEINPEYPTRTKGVVEKCDFCAERIDRGLMPVTACPEKALVFGNIADPDSAPRKILADRYTIRRKPELGTQPEVYYTV